MNVKVAVLADCANVAENAKLNIMGIFSELHADQFPVLQPYMVLALRLELEYEDSADSHELMVRVVDADGRELLSASQRLPGVRIPPGRHVYIDRVLGFPGVTVSKPGFISFRVLWDGDQKAAVPLRIVRTEQAQ